MSIPTLVRLPWPLPALAAWLLAWAVFAALAAAGQGGLPAFAAASAAGCVIAAGAQGRWRRLLAGAGFPLSALALGALPQLPGWAWLVALLPLALAYPLKAWRDAPFFPTPAQALDGLGAVVVLAPRARVLDAGCGLGHGLQALHRLWPQAVFEGVEWSRPLAWLAARRCPFAQVRRGDLWAGSWAGLDLLYVFQRPESMVRVLAKAEAEMAPGSWLVSLEFPLPGREPLADAGGGGGRPVWVYRVGESGNTSSIGPGARR
ncbi:class I SAM-dependent methyltransferase [Rubrivivax gelatinosus]|uniref:Methyltransferase type 12 n=1 Tax=Rubrivivax gelatinosus TaxID=28068 RepID=A0ABS1DTY1_RUBGE|nr:class I SAM-dependent methyltransferase [Rubrivivax gelatinosus]MBK1712958.1 methyltransferase type 12 [Rubrivivax gelatinosus]